MLVAAFVLVVDQATKGWAVSRLAVGSCTPETCIDVVGSLRFRLHYNTGASFSFGEGLGPVIGLIAIGMSVYLIWLARSATHRIQVVLFGAIAGGAVGNLADRLFRASDGILSGGVVDFIDFQWWPIFNIADVAIVGGVVVLLLTQLVQKPSVQRPAEAKSTADDSNVEEPNADPSSAEDPSVVEPNVEHIDD